MTTSAVDWKAMLQLSGRSHINPASYPKVERVIIDILDDHDRHG